MWQEILFLDNDYAYKISFDGEDILVYVYSKSRIYIKEYILSKRIMNKNIRILKIMKKKRCDWEEAQYIDKETKTLTDFC